jgi:hypothetical protein
MTARFWRLSKHKASSRTYPCGVDALWQRMKRDKRDGARERAAGNEVIR